jgi:hypothetical protein
MYPLGRDAIILLLKQRLIRISYVFRYRLHLVVPEA